MGTSIGHCCVVSHEARFIGIATIELQSADVSSQKNATAIYNESFLTLVEKNLSLD
jgi:hypothetical protein